MVKDLVCGMDIKDEEKAVKEEYNGETYSFCSSDCQTKFKENPEKFVKKEGE